MRKHREEKVEVIEPSTSHDCQTPNLEGGATFGDEDFVYDDALLREQNSLLKTVINSLGQGLSLFDSEQNLIFANQRYAEMYCLPRELLRPGTAFRRLVEHRVSEGVYAGTSPDDYIEERCAEAAAGIATTKTQRYSDGSIISISRKPLPDGGWIASHEDVTELKTAEAALRDSEELFSKAFQLSSVACAISAPKDGFHYDVNEQWMALLGYTREEALRNSAVTLGIWRSKQERDKFVDLLKQHGMWKGFETQFCRKGGEIIDVLVSGVYVEFHGEPRLFVIYVDITEQKRAQALLARQASSMSLLKSIAFTANQSTDLELALSACLEQVCQYTGWDVGHVFVPAKTKAKTLTSTNSWFLSDLEELEAFKDATESVSCTPAKTEMCCRALERGEVIWVNNVASALGEKRLKVAEALGLIGGVAFPVKIQNEVVAILEFYAKKLMEPSDFLVGILTEAGIQMGRVVERTNTRVELISYQDHLEELVEERTAQVADQTRQLEAALVKEKEVNAVQRQFVAMASHEFRTPLTIIDSAAQRLERRAGKLSPDDIVERTLKIRNAVQRMITLIESVLSSASFDAGKFKVTVDAYDLRALVTQVCARQQEISPLHKITTELDDLPTEMLGDASLMEKVFSNLLSNAVKYAPNEPKVLVVGRRQADSIYVAVKDSGVGVPKAEIPKLFQRFFRASTSTGIAGTGIGLNLVSQVVELHGGRVEVVSGEGKGSTFIVFLPIQSRAQGQTQCNSAELLKIKQRLQTGL